MILRCIGELCLPVNVWFISMLTMKTGNGYYGTLKTMLIEAVERKIIDKDPMINWRNCLMIEDG